MMEQVVHCPIGADLDRIRELVRLHAHQGGLRGERLADFVLAVNEAVTNVLDHGGAAGMLTARARPGSITVDIEDVAGNLTREHLAAAKIDPAGVRGFGLWIIQRLCDEVHLYHTGRGSRLSLVMHVPGRLPDLCDAGDRRPA